MSMDKIQVFNGIVFYEEEPGGYWRSKVGRMHRYVWEYYNGKIPTEMDVHHKDHDKSNNDISNLELLTKKDHSKRHYEELPPEQKKAKRDWMLNTVILKAAEWHKSPEAKEFHRRIGALSYKNRDKKTFKCEQCGKEFEQYESKRSGRKFCSGACAQKFRRRHLNWTTRVCVICGKEFETDKYDNTKCCSRQCGGKLSHLSRKDNKNESKVSEEDK